MSTETREQFRERMYALVGDALDKSEFADRSIGQLADMGAAVYTAALRDFRQHAATLTLDIDQVTIQEAIDAFAASLGIDLEGGDT